MWPAHIFIKRKMSNNPDINIVTTNICLNARLLRSGYGKVMVQKQGVVTHPSYAQAPYTAAQFSYFNNIGESKDSALARMIKLIDRNKW